jgi:flagellar biosynthetic protein FliR
MNILDFAHFKLETILFTYFRVAGLFLIAPLFSQQGMPSHLKIMLGLLIAVIVSPLVATDGFTMPESIIDVLVLALREMVVGLLIGFVFTSLFVGVQMAGTFIGFQMGFMIVNVVDPMTSQQVSILAQFKFIMAMLIFFLLNGHHLMLQALASSYRLVPLGESIFRFAITTEVARIITGIFIIAIKLAAPVMVTLILTDVGLGVISRTVPQMNVFIVGFPLKIMLGLFFMASALPIFGFVFRKALMTINDQTYTLLSYLAR